VYAGVFMEVSLAKGTIVKLEGFPLEIKQDTIVETSFSQEEINQFIAKQRERANTPSVEIKNTGIP
jgi:hypothetical protein